MLKFILIGVLIILVMLFFDTFLPKLKLKYKLSKELKEVNRRKEAFKKKMNELEIK